MSLLRSTEILTENITEFFYYNQRDKTFRYKKPKMYRETYNSVENVVLFTCIFCQFYG